MGVKTTERANAVLERLAHALPDPQCELDFQTPWQLLIATILSAQNTDKNVNTVTPVLFARYPTPRALADSDPDEVETIIKSTGFFRQKTKSIREASRIIADDHGSEVPKDLKAMLKLPGVARKSANLVLGTAYNIATGIIVDTHAGRVAQRVGLTPQDKAPKIEKDLMALFPEDTWVQMGHRLVLHGRYVCTARKPACHECPLNEVCAEVQAAPEKTWKTRAKTARTKVKDGMTVK